MPPFTLADWMRLRRADVGSGYKAVGRLGPGDTARFVKEVCEWGAHDDYDMEELLLLGFGLSRGRAVTAAETALDWFEAAPSAARFTPVCILLGGLWSPEDGPACTDERIVRLIEAFDRIEPGTGHRYLLCVTLRAASRTAGHSPEVVERLRAAVLTNAALLPEELGARFIERFWI